jgi:cell division septum initiation protein DivIVA
MADENTLPESDDFAERVHELVQHVESGNTEEADRILDQIAKTAREQPVSGVGQADP